MEFKKIKEEFSPSGKYRLEISSKENGKEYWNYTRGQVFRVIDNVLIASIDRNYSSFPFLFIENHPNSHDYLICGEDYQGQNVIELDTGNQRKIGSKDRGFGFCWGSYYFDTKHQILIVDGCYWAAPYEFMFYDFRDPMNGWENIEHLKLDKYRDDGEIDEDYYEDDIYSDDKLPIIETKDDGNIYITSFETVNDNCYCRKCVPRDDEEDEYDQDTLCRKGETKSIRTYLVQPDYSSFSLIEEKISDNEKLYREQRKELAEKYQANLKVYKATDPLYLEYQKQIKDPIFKIESYESTGITYKNWAPFFKKRETRWCRRINTTEPKIDLEFADKTGPIKLIIYKKGKLYETKYFAHSVASIQEAFDYSRKVIKSSQVLSFTNIINGIKDYFK